ncbi:hypothetical protein [Gaetbulibacter sp. PBL-D1]|uniref:hypothetical protein n=1 Tax=Gaetbulibacter sp. PBL-D1 TaxID=3422594 RepID=UPI003D2EA3E5
MDQFKNLVDNQLFKISKSDENISNYLIDCGGGFTVESHTKKDKSICNGDARRLESKIKKATLKRMA